MILLIDAGNTRIKWALVETTDGGRGAASGALDNSAANWSCSGVLPVEQAGELAQQLAGFPEIEQVWVSNVAGEEIAQLIRNIPAVQFHWVRAREAQCGVRNGYSDAAQLGSDRWTALIAAWRMMGRSCLVVSSGTATTIDALSVQGEFLGGLIVPGIELMQRSLYGATAQLRAAPGNYEAFPRNTADALYSGAIQASCGAIERQHALLGDSDAPVVLSGGAAEQLRKHLERLNLPLCIADNLVLQGLLLIAKEMDA
ncbi:MAG TPA: type III pantothenate kinase [Gallionella sp.]|nr:type III pantothenate kinase [Gallionella sp.]